jgi:aspartate oxidase
MNNEARETCVSVGLPLEFQKTICRVCGTYAGVRRTESGLELGLEELNELLSYVRKTNTREHCEVLNMALCAQAVFTAALKRRESVGTHYLVEEGHV